MENSLIKEEWINGVIMMSPRPEHNNMKVIRQLYKALDKYFEEKCEVAIEEALFLTKDNPRDLKNDFVKLKALITGKGAEVSPDIAVYCDKDQVFRKGFLGIPQLIIEVLSPSNHTDDTVKKKELYEKYRVPEYWIVNPSTKEIFIYSIINERYELKGEFNFLEQAIKSPRFEDLVIDIKNIELYEEDEFNI